MVVDNATEIADAIQEFLTGTRGPIDVDRMLATVLFTDIVASTDNANLAIAAGASLCNHHAIIKRKLSRFRGHEIKSTGYGILATFDGPARGVRCAAPSATKSISLELKILPASIPASAR